MFPSWWYRLLKSISRDCTSKKRERKGRGRRRFYRPLLEDLEARVVPTTPSVVSINRSALLGPETNASSVSYAVTFNESVTGVAASDFLVTTSGAVAAASPVVVSGSGASYTVGINGIHGSGSIQLDLIDNGSIQSGGVGLGAGGVNGSFQGQSYNILQVFPTVVSINRDLPTASTTAAGTVSFTVTFSEPVTGVNPTDFQFARTGTVGATLTQVTPSGPSPVYNVTISGISGNGTLGLNLVDNGSIHDLAGNPLAEQNASAAYQTQQTFAAGSSPKAVVVGDVNGDGIPDIAVANFGSYNVSVLLGNGNGSYQAQQTFATVESPGSVALGDVNGDGKPDLVVTNTTSGTSSDTVGVLLGNGNGTFQAQQTFATGDNPTSVKLADVNGDGKPDIIVANIYSYNVGVLLGNGNGTFQAQQTFTTSTSMLPGAVAVADVNGDGKPDLVVTNTTIGPSSDTVSLLLGNGNGTFQAQQTFATGARSQSLAVGDVNGDGKPDLVVGNLYGSTVSLLLGNGNGTFQPQQTFATGFSPASVALADMNGDGQLDLVVAAEAYSTVNVLLGNGNGTFQAKQVFATGQSSSLSFDLLNGDGQPDIAVANYGSNTVSVLLGSYDTFTGQVYTINPSALAVSPYVVSINRDNPAGPGTNASAVSFTVTFSESVTGVNASDFQLALGGGVSANPLVVVPDGPAVYMVTVSGITGDGTLGLNLVDNGSIHDLDGNALTEQDAGSGFLT